MAYLLLIEPDHHLGEIYAKALESDGHEVSIAKDAQKAIKLADAKVPDLVIMELELATHNGVEFLYEFRSYPDWQNVPVMVLSHQRPASGMAGQAIWSQLSITQYHYKPTTNLKALLNFVGQLVDLPVTVRSKS